MNVRTLTSWLFAFVLLGAIGVGSTAQRMRAAAAAQTDNAAPAPSQANDATKPGDAKPAETDPGTAKPAREGEVRVARLVYADGKTTVCFANGFLSTVERETRIKVQRYFTSVDAAGVELFDYPFAVFSGEGAFTLSDKQRANLAAYLKRGGFLLASAGCSQGVWAQALRREVAAMFPDTPMKKLSMDHAVFHTLYDIDHLVAKSPVEDASLYGLELQGRLVLVFSPLGLNDTARAGGGCCCCGGNELRNAHLINANMLAYTLTH